MHFVPLCLLSVYDQSCQLGRSEFSRWLSPPDACLHALASRDFWDQRQILHKYSRRSAIPDKEWRSLPSGAGITDHKSIDTIDVCIQIGNAGSTSGFISHHLLFTVMNLVKETGINECPGHSLIPVVVTNDEFRQTVFSCLCLIKAIKLCKEQTCCFWVTTERNIRNCYIISIYFLSLETF